MSTNRIIVQTAIISLVFFIILYIIMLATNYFTGESVFKPEPLHVFLALVPFIILLILSGKLKEIRGPGGIGFTMRDEVQRPVSAESDGMPLEVNRALVEEKGGIEKLRNRIAENPPTTLSFKVGRRNYYAQWAIEEYMQDLDQYRSFRFILFTDVRGRFEGIMKSTDYRALLQTGDIVEKLESRQILQDSRVIKNSIRITSTNKQALSEMERANFNLLPVVDNEDRFVGVVTQEEIVRRILTRVLCEA